MTSQAPSNNDDRIDSRDIIARLEELRDRRDDEDNIDPLDDDEAGELRKLEALNIQGEGFKEWPYGLTMIRDNHFADYIREDYPETHEDGPDLNTWPFNCIDWDRAAEETQSDYSEIDFDGVTYWTSSN